MQETVILLAALLIISMIANLLLIRGKTSTKSSYDKKEFQELEKTLEVHFADLEEESLRQYQKHTDDLNYIHKKINSLETKIKTIENNKIIDYKVKEPEQKNVINNYKNPYKKVTPEYILSENENDKIIQQSILNDALFTSEPSTSNMSVNDQVIELYKQGLKAETIAKDMEMMYGEVQLIIGIYNKRH